jgi:hypothetical protein
MKRLSVLLVVSIFSILFGSSSRVSAVTIPTISIVSVDSDNSVTVQTADFPTNTDFDVTMGEMGKKGVGGFLVDTVNSGTGGAQTYTFDIPADLQGQELIAIRLESKSGYFSYNWFENKAAEITTPVAPRPTTGSLSTPVPGFTIPTISIISVVKDDSVTLRTDHFPANTDFEVRMGKIGTLGVNGLLVDTLNSGAGGTIDATFDIPADLAGQAQISIRLDSASGYFSYNWFWNSTTTP